MSLSDQLQKLKASVEIAENELGSLNSGRKSAGPRLRKSLMDIKKYSHSMRSATTEFSKSLPTKTRLKKKEIICPTAAAVECGNINIDEVIETPKPEVAPKPVKKTRKTKPKIEKIPITE
jgi:hypothetical protein